MNTSFQNLFDLQKIIPENWDISAQKLPDLLAGIHARNQGFYSVFTEQSFQDEVKEIIKFAEQQKGKWTDIVLCGIGGSALGPLVLHQSLVNTNDPEIPNFHVLENIDPDFIQSVTDSITLETTLFLVVSKSGGTIETVSQYLYFSEILTNSHLDITDHMVIVTGDSGFLQDESKSKNIKRFSVPENIGGRFSVLTAVGLLPAALLGIDINKLLDGGSEMAQIFQKENPEQNEIFRFALACYLADEPIHVFMPYSSRLRNLGLWYTQLLAESTGKEGSGFTILPALGATDQHSQLQLFSEGPDDKLIIFLNVEDFGVDMPIAKNISGNHPQKLLKGASFKNLIHLEQKATMQSLHEKGISTVEISLPEISAYEIGKIFVFLEGVVAFFGEMMGVNAFDQPGVERGKVITRDLLSQK